MGKKIVVEVVRKANKTPKAAKPAKNKGIGFKAEVTEGGAGGKRYRIGHPSVNDGKGISSCRFVKLLGYYGFTEEMAYSLLADAGIAEFNPHTMGCQLGSGRQHARGDSEDCHHGKAKLEDNNTFGKLVAKAREHYLELAEDDSHVQEIGSIKALKGTSK